MNEFERKRAKSKGSSFSKMTTKRVKKGEIVPKSIPTPLNNIKEMKAVNFDYNVPEDIQGKRRRRKLRKILSKYR